MIFRLYGSTYQSVTPQFEAKALNEVGFRRDNRSSLSEPELAERFAHVDTVSLRTEAEGGVQNETEQLLLDRLQEALESAVARLPEGGIAIVENERGGRDQPKPRQKISNVVEGAENKLHFAYTIEPPLRVALYGPKS